MWEKPSAPRGKKAAVAELGEAAGQSSGCGQGAQPEFIPEQGRVRARQGQGAAARDVADRGAAGRSWMGSAAWRFAWIDGRARGGGGPCPACPSGGVAGGRLLSAGRGDGEGHSQMLQGSRKLVFGVPCGVKLPEGLEGQCVGREDTGPTQPQTLEFLNSPHFSLLPSSND